MAQDEPTLPAPVIRKVKKRRHDGHHGGAWKVAYADFVTAMMAFFLLLWLVNSTSVEQKRGIADYFSPTVGAMKSTSGGEGFYGGESLLSEGPLIKPDSAPALTIKMPTTRYETGARQEGEEFVDSAGNAEEPRDPSDARAPVDAAEAERVLAELEERQFAEAEAALRQAIQDTPELQQLAENLIIDNTPEGMRIQIVDQARYAMFPIGSSKMHDKARQLMAQVAKVVAKMPQKISITGHTDATPYLNPEGYDNWDLSTDRANASRRVLLESGLAAERIVHVTGKADQEPLVADDPFAPPNRRISIVLLREQRPGG